ncbi:MAG: N-acetylmuramoyl-L-alanine amidase [Bacteroidota bacterium]|nr:N-acetylmuramoyl-L-alanine amidase [Bacteroidota bacterium]
MFPTKIKYYFGTAEVLLVALVFFVGLPAVFLTGCGPGVYYAKPPGWRSESKRDSTIVYYSYFDKGWKFFVDPGHGGEDRFSHGPANDVVEADVNLRTALDLAHYLRGAGAVVYMSRTKDTTVTLSDRPKISNASGANIFISVHHNAVGNSEARSTNFTSVWYHARPTDAEYNACNQDLAKYIQRDLAYAMGNPGSPNSPSFDGTMNDYSIYPDAGFAVLRLAKIPAVLIECSFFSSAYEEQRLKLSEFNDIEAWGIFKGISRYLKAGIPKLRMISDTVSPLYRPTLVVQASDSSGIDKQSVVVKLDGKEVNAAFDPDSNLITFTPAADLAGGAHTFDVVVRNRNGNASFPFRKNIVIMPPVDSVAITAAPQQLPPASGAISAVTSEAFDEKGNPCADGTQIFLSAANGTISQSVTIMNGSALAYFMPTAVEGVDTITASASGKTWKAVIVVRSSSEKILTGKVFSAADSLPIAGAMLVSHKELPTPFSLPLRTQTYADGRYILSDELGDSVHLDVGQAGYYGKSVTIPALLSITQADFYLVPVANRVLFGKKFVLDAQFGGAETGPVVERDGSTLRTSDVNLAIARRLARLLSEAGASVTLVRKYDVSLTEHERLEYINTQKAGSPFQERLYISVNATDASGKCSVSGDATVQRTPIGQSLLWGLSTTIHRDTTEVHFGRTPFTDNIPFGALTIFLPAISDAMYSAPVNYVADRCAWGIYRGLLKANGYQETAATTFSQPAGTAPPYATVVLDNALSTVSAGDGSFMFYGVTGGMHRTRVEGK